MSYSYTDSIPMKQTILKDIGSLLSDTSHTDITIIVSPASLSEQVNILAPAQTSTSKRKHASFESAVESEQSEVRIPAHKCILAARSPVFRTMFASGMAESLTNEVRIHDFEAVVVKEFIRFLYTEQCDYAILTQYVRELLSIACKYQVSSLKSLCENQLCSTLNTTNVGNILYLADMYDATQLEVRALDYVTNHAKQVVKANLTVHELSPKLSQKVLRALAGVDPDSKEDGFPE